MSIFKMVSVNQNFFVPIYEANFNAWCLTIFSGSWYGHYIYKWVLTQRCLGATALGYLCLMFKFDNWKSHFVLICASTGGYSGAWWHRWSSCYAMFSSAWYVLILLFHAASVGNKQKDFSYAILLWWQLYINIIMQDSVSMWQILQRNAWWYYDCSI